MRISASRLLVAAATLSLMSGAAAAHRPWLLPSITTLSSTVNWVTIDAAVSDDLFYPDHFPLPIEGIKVWQPDGSAGAIQNAAKGRYRSTFDVQIDKLGTWKIGTAGTTVSGSFRVDGEDWTVGRRRGPAGGMGQPGRGGVGMPGAGARGDGDRPASGNAPSGPSHSVATPADIPPNATDVTLSEATSRNEIFVTAGAPTTTVLQPTGQGLEMVPITHPDELVSNEPARFRFVIDGKPAAGLKVALIPGGKRYRDSEGGQDLTTKADGVLTITWGAPGMYWLNATATDNRATTPHATERRMTYTSTLEVLAP